MNVLLVPTLGLDLTLIERLKQSIDYMVDFKIVQNGSGFIPCGEGGKYAYSFHQQRDNIGVAASWNLAPRLFNLEKAWIICNEDVQFERGALGEFCRKVDELADTEPFIMWNDTDPFYVFAWTRVGVERFGLFDENFFPAYEEDADMRMRWAIEGYRPPNVFGKDCPLKHGKPQCGGPRYAKMIQDGSGMRRFYFQQKWGTLDFHNPVFKTPFNDPSKSIKDWEIDPVIRRHLQWTWDDFINQPNPSIYT